MSMQGVRGVRGYRGQIDRKLGNAQCLLKGLVRQSRIATDKFAGAIHYHLRSVDAVQAKAVGIRALPLAVEAGRVRVLPADMVPVVDVLAEHDHFRALYGLPVQFFEKPVCWGTTGASLRCEEFHQHRSTGFRSSIRPTE